MRASSLVLGPLVARCGRARVSMPGGCAIGARPINLHVLALEQLGASIEQAHGYIEAEAPNGLHGARGSLRSHHGDRHRGSADGGGAGKRRNVLRQCGARTGGGRSGGAANARWARGSKARARPSSACRALRRLHGAEHTIIADRIEAGTFLMAGAITRGDVLVTGCVPEHVGALIVKMRQAGAEITEESPESLARARPRRPKSVDMTTEEYPGFATDLQAQYMA